MEDAVIVGSIYLYIAMVCTGIIGGIEFSTQPRAVSEQHNHTYRG